MSTDAKFSTDSSTANDRGQGNYSKPVVTYLGSFSSLTRAMQMGPYADMTFELMMMQ